ncbi:DUF4347 domain-containing protein [Methylobacter sp.]
MTQVTTPIQNLLVIDSRVKDWQSLVAGVSANTAILILDPNSDGLTQISNYLTAKAGLPLLQGIQIFSHGSAGSLLLGSSTITNSTLNLYTKQLAKIGTSLTDTGDVLLYGCNVAANKTGVDFINQFAALTNADVAASNNLTGSAALGGDWQLEASTGSIEATAALTSTTLNSYTGSLVAITPSVKVSAGITPEESGATGSFTFTLDSAAPAGGLTINYSLAGTATLSTDYSVTAGTNVTAVTGSSFTIAAGQTTATLAINAVSDGIYDPNETVVFTLAAGTGYVVSYNLSLAPKVDFATGFNPYSVSVGDFNGDGKTDLAVANAGSNTVSVLLRNAANTGFASKVDFATGSNPSSVSVGDFNGDGKTDLAVADTYSNTVSVLSNNSTATASLTITTNALPTLTTFAAPVASGNDNSQIPVTFANLIAQGNEADVDGSVIAFVIKAVSTGTLTIGSTAATAAVWNASTNNTIDATHQAFWTQAPDASGTLNAFTAVAKDNGGEESTTAIQATIYVNAVLNNLTLNGTQGNDTLIGDAIMSGSYDALNGLAGNDILNGLAGIDTLNGDLGNDILDGGLGGDTMTGGLGNDTYVVDSLTDVVIETSTLVTEIDTVRSGVTYTLGANLENLVLTGNSAINGIGNALNNTITGNAAANILEGGLGRDTLTGGAGNDLYNIDASDIVVELANGGSDTVQIASGYTLVNSYIENATLTGFAAANLVGNLLDNVLTGNSADNVLNGGRGADSMAGGAGNDTYVIDDSGDTVTEAVAEGKDTVISQISYILGANLEGLRLLGANAINGTGNVQDNLLVGNSADNTLIAGAGADQLIGGDGNDTYYIDTSDQVFENIFEGTADRVIISDNWTLGDNLENLDLTGTGNFNGTGNEADNIINGNSGNNILDGKSGADTMNGGYGNDIYLVDNIGDIASENFSGTGIDLVKSTVTHTLGYGIENLTLLGTLAIDGTGNNLDNVIKGNSGRNILDGSYGADSLFGGAGADDLYSSDGLDTLVGGLNNDTYYVCYDSDNIIEQSAQGTDTVVFGYIYTNSAYAYTLGANLENLILIGGDIDGHGNSLNNAITGSNGNNLLDGGTGIDVLRGLKGNDTYLIDNVNDQIIEILNEGIDEALSSVSYTLAQNVDNLSLIGASAINGTGNIIANRLIGNDAANTLSGLDGNDVLLGGGGNDILIGGNGNDSLNGGIGNDQLNGGAGIDSANYFNMAAGVKVDLTITAAQNTGNGGIDTLTGIESIDGSNSGADELSGDGLDNRIYGYGGNDTLRGGAGNDILSGGEGDDTLFGDAGNDGIDGGNGVDMVSYYSNAAGVNIDLNILTTQNTGGAGLDILTNIENIEGSNKGNDILTGDENNNILSGFGGNDVLEGGAGDDILNGGSGNDTADFSGATEEIVIELFTGATTNDGFGSIDTLISIENLIGGDFDDLLWGDSGANILDGGAGNDSLTGGAGNDIFDFNALTDLGLGDAARDVITDFVSGQDKIDFSTIDSNAALAGDQAFTLIGSIAAFSTAGQIRYSAGLISINTDTDVAAEFEIQLTGVIPATLAATDFVL